VTLSDKDRRLLRLSTSIIVGNFDELAAVRASAPPGEPDRAWREVVLQVHLFAGIPRQIAAYEVLEQAGGLGTIGPEEHLRTPALRENGLGPFELIYGANAEIVERQLIRFHPDFADWVLGHGYGRAFPRPGLTIDRRELVAVAALAALGQDRQLASHVRGSIRVGAPREEIEASVEAVRDLIGDARADQAQAIVERFART
jgi:alkylhydroperoxidase/carboxymuconolactone decarboxylase family protein YurZ